MNTEVDVPPGKIIARVAAGTSFMISSGTAAASLDKFASWFLTAFGAGLALIVSNLKDVSVFIPQTTLASAAHLFLIAAVVCVAQRFLALVIVGGAKAAKEGREMGEKLEHMDGEEFLSQMLQGLPWLLRKMCKQQFDALRKGDFAAGGRMFMRLAIWHGILVTIELVVLLVALARVINGITA